MAQTAERNGFRILVADPIAEAGVATLRRAGEVDVRTGLPAEELVRIIPDYDAMVVRSETKVTEPMFQAAANLKVVARAGVGVDNIDVPAATRHGVVVVNSPEGNTIAAAEHTVAMLLSLSRKIPGAAASLKSGEWKRSKFTGVEIQGKT
ncbi:MAG TPA: phosphoglycerate dehydrogenase, partial [Armatimonadota bacterium]|nr:phosphoglycerate dehydrogenase [Armatimonadota bacterium]